MNKSVLVLGGAGFLGRRILSRLKSREVSPECGDIVPARLEGIADVFVDVLDRKAVVEICRKHDLIINCTGQASTPGKKCLRLNSSGIRNIAEACAGEGKKLIQISSTAVYGSREFADEETEMNPETTYSTCKAFAELLLAEICDCEKLAILRLSNLYGPDQEKGLFSYLRRSFKGDRRLEFDNPGSLLRYYLHVEDCVGIIDQLVSFEGIQGVFNIVGPDRLTIRQIVETVEKNFGIRYKISYSENRLWDNVKEISDGRIRNLIDPAFLYRVDEFIANQFE